MYKTKRSIPREALEKIMADYRCSEEQAAQAYLNAQDQANEAFHAALSQKLGPRSAAPEDPSPKVFTPREIKAHLDKFVIGQEVYKKRLAIAAAYHFAMIKYLRGDPDDVSVKRFRKKNTLITGPSGSGKTYCVEVLGDLLQVPTLIVDATDYTEAGYVGKNADDMIRELIELAPGRTRKEQARFISSYGGVICIDEIDKKAKDGRTIGHDISREGFQRSVLKLIERKSVSIDNPYSPASQIQEAMDRQSGKLSDKQANMVSTENILFILGGSFERAHDDLESLVKKRIQHRGQVREDGSVAIRGFAAASDAHEKDKFPSYYKEADADDFIQFGLLPELVGRTPIRTFVNLLSKNDLVRIMCETEDSILNQYRLEFQLFDIKVQFTPEAIEYVAQVAENRKTGARALVSMWEQILTDFQFELPGSNFSFLEVNRKLCTRPQDVLLKMLEKSPFVDFLEFFKKEYGVELILNEEIEAYIETYAREHRLQVSEALRKLLLPASALNYMGVKAPFAITLEMVRDETYFDRLFTQWYQEQKQRSA